MQDQNIAVRTRFNRDRKKRNIKNHKPYEASDFFHHFDDIIQHPIRQNRIALQSLEQIAKDNLVITKSQVIEHCTRQKNEKQPSLFARMTCGIFERDRLGFLYQLETANRYQRAIRFFRDINRTNDKGADDENYNVCNLEIMNALSQTLDLH